MQEEKRLRLNVQNQVLLLRALGAYLDTVAPVKTKEAWKWTDAEAERYNERRAASILATSIGLQRQKGGRRTTWGPSLDGDWCRKRAKDLLGSVQANGTVVP